LISIVSEPSASNKSKTSRISVFCSSVNLDREIVVRFLVAPPGVRRFIEFVAVVYFD